MRLFFKVASVGYVGCHLLILATPQEGGQPVSIIEAGRYRIAFPSAIEVRARDAQLVFDALQSQRPLRGVPADAPAIARITVSIVPNPYAGFEAWSFGRQGLIVLPLEEVFTWDREKRERVIRHELAHVTIERYVTTRQTVRWFREGLAEWMAGGLSCEGQIRLGLNVALWNASGEPIPGLADTRNVYPSRLAYDLYASFFAFLEEVSPGVVDDGTLLSQVRAMGVTRGILTAIAGTGYDDFESLERAWSLQLVERYTDARKQDCAAH